MKLKSILFILFCAITYIGNTSANEIDLSSMTPKELFEFYKSNPDYGKKKVGLNYDSFITGDYVVIRGEYTHSGSAIPNIPINAIVGEQRYVYTTSTDGVFNIEIPKKEFIDDSRYKISIEVEQYKLVTRKTGKELKEKSIYHFRIDTSAEKPRIQNKHNILYVDGESPFQEKIETIVTPSILGIQGIWIFVIGGVCVVFTIFFFFNGKIKNENTINIPDSLK